MLYRSASSCAQCRFRPSGQFRRYRRPVCSGSFSACRLESFDEKAEENSEERSCDRSRKNVIWYFAERRSRLLPMNVPATYSGIDRVVEYDFTHRDVPEAFEGFRIAFISDLHYKSLLKEKGLNNLVDLLIAQKPDVLLMGGDYQEGCEYVEPLFAALARVKTPMGTFWSNGK